MIEILINIALELLFIGIFGLVLYYVLKRKIIRDEQLRSLSQSQEGKEQESDESSEH